VKECDSKRVSLFLLPFSGNMVCFFPFLCKCRPLGERCGIKIATPFPPPPHLPGMRKVRSLSTIFSFFSYKCSFPLPSTVPVGRAWDLTLSIFFFSFLIVELGMEGAVRLSHPSFLSYQFLPWLKSQKNERSACPSSFFFPSEKK